VTTMSSFSSTGSVSDMSSRKLTCSVTAPATSTPVKVVERRNERLRDEPAAVGSEAALDAHGLT
jgi:hypothetical protein